MLLLDSFTKISAAALVPFVKATKKLPATMDMVPTKALLGWAWGYVCSEANMFTRKFFLTQDAGVAFLMVRLVGMVDLKNPPRSTYAWNKPSPVRTAVNQIVSATAEEMEAWLMTPEALELMAVAEDRLQTWCAISEFARREHRILYGECSGIPVFSAERVDWIFEKARMSDDGSDSPGPQRAMELARLYIDAAVSLVPDFKAAGFNAGYGENNLPYLKSEYEESGQLYRVFVPFVPVSAEESPLIEGAKNIALMRAILDPPDEPDFPLTPEVQRLLDIIPAEE